MLRFLIAIVVAASCVCAEENRWIWGKNNRNQRVFNDEGGAYGNSLYGREKDRESTTRRPLIGQANDEDSINPDDQRNYNGPPNFGYPSSPGYGAPGAYYPQGFPSSGYPGQSGPGQPNYPTGPSGFGGGYPSPGAGAYPTAPNNGYPGQSGYPNPGVSQGYPPTGQFPSGPTAGGYPGFPGYPGLGNLFGLGGGYPGQGGFPGQNPLFGNQGNYPPGFGTPYPTQGGGYPTQPGYPTHPGYPSQYPGGANYSPQQAGHYPTGQFSGCGQYGRQCPGGQFGQHPGQYPGQYPGQHPNGQHPNGHHPNGQYPFPDPYASYNGNNPYGITPYNKANEYASAFDDFDGTSKNTTSGSNRALIPEGKSLNINNFVSGPLDDKIRKIAKS